MPRPRLVDWSILGGLFVVAATGLLSLVAGEPQQAWVFDLHGVAGLVVVVLLAWKLRRVGSRLRPRSWDRTTPVSLLTLLVAFGALASGIYWVFGGDFMFLLWNALTIHAFLGIVLIPIVTVHLWKRWRPLRMVDFEGRRTALQYTVLLGGGVIAWRLQEVLVSFLNTAGAKHRFTGSKERGLTPGNTFPVTSWVADDPDPVDRSTWRLQVIGAVDREQAFSYDELTTESAKMRATLDCTSGWYTTQTWDGVRIGDLLDRVRPADEARWVSFRSTTGYRWSLPIEETRDALLATHVGGERLSHGHGFPLRLVAPGRRGFQWVKWVQVIEVRTKPDYGQWLAIFSSGFNRNS